LGNTLFIVISVVAIVFVLYLILKSNEDKLGLSLILGGAAGNLLDRIFFGSVIDFIDVFAGRLHWPAFNVADSVLTIGIVVMLIRSFSHSGRKVKTGVSGIN
ncbi:MAG: signal peptidase II, partial [Nitrospirota bacterium]